MDAPDLSSLFDEFDQKISNVCAKLALLDNYMDSEDDRDYCLKLNENLGSIQYLLHDMNEFLNKNEIEFTNRKNSYDNHLKSLEDHIDYIERNYNPPPPQPPTTTKTKTQPTPAKETVTSTKRSVKTNNNNKNHQILERNNTYTNLKSSKKTTAAATKTKSSNQIIAKQNSHVNDDNGPQQQQPPEEIIPKAFNFPIIEMINKEEYDLIPKYMLARLSLDTLNESVGAFNQTIEAKYSFIKKFDIKSTKDAEYKRFQEYKSQENNETKGILFVTIKDIKELSSMQNDATLRKVLTCLRHCKRIKEIRTNKLIRYSLI